MATRVQRKRTAGWITPVDSHGRKAVYVGRGTRWGNPFAIERLGSRWTVIDINDRSKALRENPQVFTYKHDAAAFATSYFELNTVGVLGAYAYDDETLTDLRRKLAGRDLLCWCPIGQPCHADVLLRVANR